MQILVVSVVLLGAALVAIVVGAAWLILSSHQAHSGVVFAPRCIHCLEEQANNKATTELP